MPAPYRHLFVRGVLGNTYAAVASSDEFSAWVQVPNREAGAGTIGFDVEPGDEDFEGTERVTNSFSEAVPDPPVPVDLYPGDVSAMMEVIASSFSGLPAHNPTAVASHVPWGIRTGSIPDVPDDDPFYFSHSLSAGLGAGMFTKVVDLGASRWNPAWRPTWPAGAIGYEVELAEIMPGQWEPFSEVLEAQYAIEVEASVSRGTLSGVHTRLVIHDGWGEGVLRLGGTSGPRWLATGQAAAAVEDERPIVDYPFYRQYQVDMGLTAMVEDSFPVPASHKYHGAYVGFFALTRIRLRDVPTGPPPPVVVTVTNDGDGDMFASPGVDYLLGDFTYTIKPPRIRWIYGEVVETPYRRTFPRDDGLAGGAPRTFPPSMAEQNSNRVAGGYF